MTSSSTTTTTPRIKESAALLFAWSLFALIEGTIRMTTNSKPFVGVDYWATEDASGTRIMPVGVLLMGGCAEVLFGIVGSYVSFLSLLLDHNSVGLTKMFLVIQVICGWFVFLTFVIATPIIKATQAGATDILTASENKALILLGNMLGSICFCWALQGGQFIMGLRLLAAQQGDLDSKEKNQMRARVWAGNVIAASFSTLFVGGLLASKGFTSTTAPVPAPPHVVWFPAISIVTGIVMLGYGVVSCMAVSNTNMNGKLSHAWLICTTMMMVNFSWTFGIVPGLAGPIPGSAQHIGLIFAVTILPLFHSHRSHHLLEDDNDDNEEQEQQEQENLKQPEQPDEEEQAIEG